MIDCHVLLQPNRENYQAQLFALLEREPVNIIKLDAVQGHIGQARHAGFRSGSSEFVTFVDDDDLIEPGMFAAALDVLQANEQWAGVFFHEQHIDNAGNKTPSQSSRIPYSKTALAAVPGAFHHGLFRRWAVERVIRCVLDWPTYPEPVLFANLAARHPMGKMDSGPSYLWRRHELQATKTMRNTEEYAEITKHITRLLFAPRSPGCKTCGRGDT